MPVSKTHVKSPDPAAPTCENCEHLLTVDHTVTGAGAGPNGTDNLRCNICGASSGTHHAGWREGLTNPKRTTHP